VSCLSLPEPDPDQKPLVEALEAKGFEVATVAWDDPSVDWAKAPLTVLRSCWNYPQAPNDFRTWLEAVAPQTRLVNPLDAVLWNLHKSYLLRLQTKSVRVAPTAVAARHQSTDLCRTMAEHGWSEVVIKPAMSANSWRTLYVSSDSLDEGQAHLDALTSERDALIQCFLPSVNDYGERSLVYVDGVLTHAVRKDPRFMTGAAPRPHVKVEATENEQTLAAGALAALRAEIAPSRFNDLLYARVDMTPGLDGQPILMELELIEPSLWFAMEPRALARFVEGVARMAGRS
ncbi:MAG: hypothetical protein AAF449_14665, partial [Myxococcota bacterium]